MASGDRSETMSRGDGHDHGPGGVCRKIEDYHRADPFRYSLNSFLRVLKEVPQIVQMQLQHEPGFKVFFATVRRTLEQDALFGALAKKRDFIVHHGMLIPKSTVHVGASRGRGTGINGIKIAMPFPASPSEDSDAVMARFIAFCEEHPRAFGAFGPASDQYACVHRVWVLSDFPDVEIRALAATAWKHVGSMLGAVLVWLGHDLVSFDFPCLEEHLSPDTQLRLYPRSIFPQARG
jgi:hypothetical protein